MSLFFIILILFHSQKANSSSFVYSSISLPYGLKQQQVAFSSPNIYLFGGYAGHRSDGKCVSNGTLKYNIKTNEKHWTILNDYGVSYAPCLYSTEGYFSQSNVVIGNTVYFVGIPNINTNEPNHQQIYMFNISNDQWINNNNIANMIYSSQGGCIVSNHTHIFMFGGIYYNQSLHNKNYLQIYDITKNKWNAYKIPFIKEQQWSDQMCTIIDNSVYIFGGILMDNKGLSVATNIIYKYDIITNQWLFINNLTDGLANGWSVYYKSNNSIYLIGGNNDNPTNKYYIFNVTKGEIVGSGKLLKYINNAPALIIDEINEINEIMIFGGYGCDSNNNNNSCHLMSSVQVSNLPLKGESSDSVKNLYWRIGALIGGIIVFFVLGYWIEMRRSNSKNANKRINKDTLIVQNDMNRYYSSMTK